MTHQDPEKYAAEIAARAGHAPEQGADLRCERCGASPARVNTYMRVMSFLVLTRPRTWQALHCRDCATRTALGELGKSVALGWWGIPWGLMTFAAIFRNVRSLARWSRLPAAAALALGVLCLAPP